MTYADFWTFSEKINVSFEDTFSARELFRFFLYSLLNLSSSSSSSSSSSNSSNSSSNGGTVVVAEAVFM
jgi:hypothetical protein